MVFSEAKPGLVITFTDLGLELQKRGQHKQIETLAVLAVQWSGARVPKSRSNFTPLQTKGKG